MSEVAAEEDFCDASSSGSSGSDPIGSPPGALDGTLVASFFFDGFGAGSDPVGLDQEPFELVAAGVPVTGCPCSHAKSGITHGCAPGKQGMSGTCGVKPGGPPCGIGGMDATGAVGGTDPCAVCPKKPNPGP